MFDFHINKNSFFSSKICVFCCFFAIIILFFFNFESIFYCFSSISLYFTENQVFIIFPVFLTIKKRKNTPL